MFDKMTTPIFPDPQPFSGRPDEVQCFLTALHWKLEYTKDQFGSDQQKMAYAISHTVGDARKHFLMLVRNDGEVCFPSLESFYDHVRAHFNPLASIHEW